MDLIRQSMFAADTVGSVDPRIKSGGDEFGRLKRFHMIGKRSSFSMISSVRKRIGFRIVK